jgi:uncharacterized protein
MADPFVDTDVIIRLLTNDDPKKQVESAALFETVEAGSLTLRTPDTVIADAVYVLSSIKLYNLSRELVHLILQKIVSLPNFKVKNKKIVLLALQIYAGSKIDFGDAMILASMKFANSKLLYSYDKDFDHFAEIKRLKPS